MPDRFAEHPNLLVTMTNVKFSELGFVESSTKIKDKKIKQFTNIYKFEPFYKNLESCITWFAKNKKLSKLVSQWKVAGDQLDPKRTAGAPAKSVEERTDAEIERWKREQLKSDAALSNANFVEVPKDWRKRREERLQAQARKST